MSIASTTLLKEDEVNEHELMSKWEMASSEDKIRFLNLVFDEICGTTRKVQEGGDDTRESRDGVQNNNEEREMFQPERLVDGDEAYAGCNVDVLEFLQGSSGHNVFRRRMLMWHLMKMNTGKEGGIWQTLILNNRQLRVNVSELEANVAELHSRMARKKELFEERRNDDIFHRDVVVGRLKTRLEKTETEWSDVCDTNRTLERELAVCTEEIEKHATKMQRVVCRAEAAERSCEDKDREMSTLRVKIWELEQEKKNRNGVAPSVRLIVQAALAEKKKEGW